MDVDSLTQAVIGAGIEVHRALGPGLLESAYEECLCRELELRHVAFRRQLGLPVTYKGLTLESGYRLDLLVENQVVVEIRAVEGLLPVHSAQLLTYMKLGNWPAGLLLNFHTAMLKDGIRRMVNPNLRTK